MKEPHSLRHSIFAKDCISGAKRISREKWNDDDAKAVDAAIAWYRRKVQKDHRSLKRRKHEDVIEFYLRVGARPSANVTEVLHLVDKGKIVVLKDHTGGRALPTYPVLEVFHWNG